jgi:hydrogenase expression/formation protein HypC
MAFPMQVIAVDGLTARCEARGAERQVSLWAMLDDLPAPGEHLMVHLDRAVQRLSAEEAAAAWATLDEIQAALSRAGSRSS